jgi:hypothetical protein
VEPVHQTVHPINISERQQQIQLQKEFYNHVKTAQVLVLPVQVLLHVLIVLKEIP